MTDACRCLTAGVTGRDEARHAAWHALVLEQGGPAELVNVETLRAARRPVTDVPRPDPEERARFRAQLVAAARRNGKHAVAERPPWAR